VKYTPRAYQVEALAHVTQHACAALFLDMGLGKTVVALTLVASLLDRAEIRAVLIVAPLRVIQLTWPQQVKQWDHTKGLSIATVHGLPSTRIAALKPGADIYLINYENMIWLTEWLEDNKAPFDAIIWDESSKMKNPSARRFKRMKPLLYRFHRNLILSGTPSPKAYLDLWSQFYLLDRGRRLESYVTRFRDMYFEQVHPMSYEYKLREGAAERIEKAIEDITLSQSAVDHLDMPPRTVNRVLAPLPATLAEKYKILEKELFVRLGTLDVEAFNAAALSNKCLQFTAGVVYAAQTFNKDGKPEPQRFESIHTTKLDALGDIIEGAQGQSVLVCFWYKSELAILRKAYPKAPTLDGATSAADAVRLVDEWNAGTVPVMFAHPASAGHGLNLQAGGHILVFTTLPWSLELYQQTVARLHRQGQTHPVIVHHLICPGTVDEAVESSLSSKDAAQSGLLASLRAYAANRKK
jgi:SNF2 family DNA or RNA helicase